MSTWPTIEILTRPYQVAFIYLSNSKGIPDGYIWNIVPPFEVNATWSRVIINLPPLTNYPSIQLLLVAYSNSSLDYDGLFVDEICIKERETLPQCPGNFLTVFCNVKYSIPQVIPKRLPASIGILQLQISKVKGVH